jgi:hypothetical protein
MAETDKSKKAVDEKSVIGKVIAAKGAEAGKIMDEYFCNDGEGGCCPRTSLSLGFAAKLKKKEEILPKLIELLNAMPDVC